MLLIGSEQIIEGVSVYDDDSEIHVKYLVAGRPSFRTDALGKPAVSLFKYRFPVDRPDGKVGGGFLLMDVAFTVTPEQQEACRQVLQGQVDAKAREMGITQPPAVEFGTIRYIDGTCNLIIAEAGGALVEKVSGAGKPSLYGENAATFGVELTPEGATFFERAMQSDGPVIGLELDLEATGKLPAVTANSHFHSHKFYSFIQTVDSKWRWFWEDDRIERMHEYMSQSEAITMEFDFGEDIDEDTQTEIRNWVFDMTTEAAERNMIEKIVPASEEQRELPKGIEDVDRMFTDYRVSDFTLEFKEQRPIVWKLRPTGSLPPFSSLRDADGNALNFNDYFREIDLDDDFMKKLRVNVMANADFDRLPLHSVEVKLGYNGAPMPNLEPGAPEGEVVLTGPDQIGKFASFVANDDYNYEYSYRVNYKNQSRAFDSEKITTDEGNLTVNVGQMGVLDVVLIAGDINWNDVSRALVTFKYKDTGVDPIEHQVSLTADATEHRITEVIFEPMRKNYSYQVKYFMKNGSEFVSDEQFGRSPNLFINDIFAETRTVTVNGLSDFANVVANIFVDLVYEDAENDYRQSQSVVLNGNSPFATWSFPVVKANGGQLTYSGTVAMKDGTTQEIEKQAAEGNMILVPKAPEEIMKVEILSDLIDWTASRLLRVTCSYVDQENGVNENQTFTFNENKTDPQSWHVSLMDASKKAFSYEWTLFQKDGSRVSNAVTDSTDTVLIIDPMSV